ncbi:hypothetical protein N7478_001393 [Penicillium angulare]|uniref:uncharacterized protein n=1 Tax=Penicillium angulare TaxID=116970 RepID=UPI0025421113|nr:uncharacterized protein N7478_001393 [Penicillium angulare]KAJ5292142.1 hypothetical protein N7478_001393 [Penicillium angulare]
MIDVGGQRSERRKWIHCFEDVDCLILVAAGCDQCLVEDHNAQPVIIFFNKFDLFRDKLAVSPISAHLPDINCSETDSISAAHYFVRCLQELNKTRDWLVYEHHTNATDTGPLKTTMNSVHDIVVKKNLRSQGLLL